MINSTGNSDLIGEWVPPLSWQQRSKNGFSFCSYASRHLFFLRWCIWQGTCSTDEQTYQRYTKAIRLDTILHFYHCQRFTKNIYKVGTWWCNGKQPKEHWLTVVEADKTRQRSRNVAVKLSKYLVDWTLLFRVQYQYQSAVADLAKLLEWHLQLQRFCSKLALLGDTLCLILQLV